MRQLKSNEGRLGSEAIRSIKDPGTGLKEISEKSDESGRKGTARYTCNEYE